MKIECKHCGGFNFSNIETDTCYENGIDDPQYGGNIVIIKYRKCLSCGELRDENEIEDKFNHKELNKDEIWVFNSNPDKLPNRDGQLKTMRFGKQAFDINGKLISSNYKLPVFIHISELDLLNKLW